MSSATTKRKPHELYVCVCFARISVLWEVMLLRLLKQELQNLKLSMVGLISALEQPKPCDIGTKRASLDDPHTSAAHGCVCVGVCVLDDWHAAGRGNRSGFDSHSGGISVVVCAVSHFKLLSIFDTCFHEVVCPSITGPSIHSSVYSFTLVAETAETQIENIPVCRLYSVKTHLSTYICRCTHGLVTGQDFCSCFWPIKFE